MPAESQEIGSTLKALRLRKGLNLVEVANQAGLSVSELHRFESGANAIPSPLLCHLLMVLGSSLGEFELELAGGDPSAEDAARRAGQWLLRFADAAGRGRW